MDHESSEDNKSYIQENVETKVSQKLIRFSADTIVSRDNISSIRKFQESKLESRWKNNWHADHYFSNPPLFFGLIRAAIILLSIVFTIPVFFESLGADFDYEYVESVIVEVFPRYVSELYMILRSELSGEGFLFIVFILIVYVVVIHVAYSFLMFALGSVIDNTLGPHSRTEYKVRVPVRWYVAIGMNSGEIILKKLSSESYMEDYIEKISELIEAKIDASTYYVINDKGGVIQSVGDNATLYNSV